MTWKEMCSDRSIGEPFRRGNNRFVQGVWHNICWTQDWTPRCNSNLNQPKLTKVRLLIQMSNLQCNELNQGHPTFFYLSQDEFRTKESEFIHIGPMASEGLAVKSSFSSTKRQLNINWKAPWKMLGGPGWVRYTVMRQTWFSLNQNKSLCQRFSGQV